MASDETRVTLRAVRDAADDFVETLDDLSGEALADRVGLAEALTDAALWVLRDGNMTIRAVPR